MAVSWRQGILYADDDPESGDADEYSSGSGRNMRLLWKATAFWELNGNAAADPELPRRAFDDIHAGLLKYAEPCEPI